MFTSRELLWLLALGLALAVGFAVAFVAHLWFWVRRLTVAVPYALEERITLEDGAAIELRRLVPPASPATLPPVLLVHGIAANHRNVDLDAERSLARDLHARGRDVWLVTLRSGLRAPSRRIARLVRFAHMVRYDLPVALASVRARAQAAQIDYVGFSMGGMLMYAALGRTVAPSVLRRAVFVGSPAQLRAPVPLPRWFARVPLALVPTLSLRLWARAWAFAAEWFPTPLHRWVINPANVARGVPRWAMVNMIEDVPAGLGRDFAAWIVGGGALVYEGAEVLAGLARVSLPALFIAGAADRIAPPDAVRAAYEAWGAAVEGVEKRMVVLGREQGARADYGHGDLVIGAHAGVDLFGPVGEFLDRD